ncbi:hypothetical protein NDU88_008493 [Pleurodeles waltl]|uniref:Peptidase A2 domain-containing protein n=1 Tax=Pleurodeles waltl TaxID=8319 RepID=A0AAV7RX10_PLEWA|nr:hypothetical protein NDU88_008493 [Pleurodeles waltl]
MMVQEGVVHQSNDVNAFQNVKGPRMRGPNPNFQNNMVQMQGLQPMQQVQMPRVQPMQMQQMQQQVPLVARQQMTLPLAPMGQQQVMLPQQVTGQGMGQNNAVQQFPLCGENGINDERSDESSDGEECRLAASLEVDQRGPIVQGNVMGHKVSFLVDTGATRSTVRSAEVPKLPLSGRTVKVVGVANHLLTNPIIDPVQFEIGTSKGCTDLWSVIRVPCLYWEETYCARQDVLSPVPMRELRCRQTVTKRGVTDRFQILKRR